MKRSLFGVAAMATMFLAGCSNSEVVENYQRADDAISFGSTLSKTTRATPFDAFKANDKFAVQAYFSEDSNFDVEQNPVYFMKDQMVGLNDAGVWEYAPIKYWPSSGKISFFAATSADASGNNVLPEIEEYTDFSGGESTYDYNECEPYVAYAAANKASQRDLLWGVNSEGAPHLNVTKAGVDGTVFFDFKHALARIGFEVQLGNDIAGSGTDDQTTVVLEKLEIIGAFYTAGNLHLNNPEANVAKWSDEKFGDNVAKNTADAVKDDANKLTFAFVTFDELGGVESNFLRNESFVNKSLVNQKGDYMLVIPQAFPENTITINIEYEVTTKEVGLGSDNKITFTNKQTLTLPKITFENGNAYKLLLTIGLDSVKFDGSILDWAGKTVYAKF